MELNKKFGLIIPPKRKPNAANVAPVSLIRAKPSVFADDSDEAEESDPKEAAKGLKQGLGTTTESSASLSSYRREEIEAVKKKALEQDPNVFDYDATYDVMQEKRKQQRFVESSGPGPKKVLVVYVYVYVCACIFILMDAFLC